MLLETVGSFLSGDGGGGGLLGGQAGESSSAAASSGGPFTSGAISFGNSLDTKTLLIIGVVIVAGIYLWKK